MSRLHGINRALFPRGVRLWHFILLPPLAMAVVLGASRIIDQSLARHLYGPASGETYHAVRTVLIALAMASVVGLLAIKYLITFLQKYSYRVFVWYRVLAGLSVLILILLRIR